MKKYLNTLFVTTQGAYLNKEGEAVVVSVEREIKMRMPIHTLGGIVCFGNVLASPFLMHHCAENNVLVSFLSENGRFLARVQGPVNGNVLLRRQQYRLADDRTASAHISRAIVLGKAANARTVLQRAVRDHENKAGMEAVEAAVDRLGTLIRLLQGEQDLDAIRGREGDIGRVYFSVFDKMITAQKDAFSFTERTRRPPMDNMNALLSFIYTLLAHDCIGALEAVGLDPQVGFLHRDRPGRPSLALDLMEEFRPWLADRLAITLINRQQIGPDDFKLREGGAVEFTDAGRKRVIKAYQERKQEALQHPLLDQQLRLGQMPFVQARLLARHLRGDVAEYIPLVPK